MKKGEKGVNHKDRGRLGFYRHLSLPQSDHRPRDFGTIATAANGRRSYPFHEMEAGDCFCVPYLSDADARSVRSSVRICARLKGRMISTQKSPGGIFVTVLPVQSA